MEPESFFHVAIKVDSLEEGLDFYRQQFDAELLERGHADNGEGATAVNHAALDIADKRVYLFDRAPYEAAGLVEDVPTGFSTSASSFERKSSDARLVSCATL